ncbi:MAG: InlB B-repeat-containing protein, partial [Mogibacterium sp.]|nr:InlB B-repeat-containing protein [Mogibacterium sp.]
MKNNTTLKRFMALLLCAAMLITYMPSPVYTLATGATGEPSVASEEEAKESEPAAETPKAEEPSKDAETPKEESAPKTEEPKADSAPTEESGKTDQKKDNDASETSSKDEASEPKESSEPADTEEPAVTEEEPKDEEPAEDEAEEAYPAQHFEKMTPGFNRVQVIVDAPEGAFPKDTTMKVKNVAEDDVNDAVKKELGEGVNIVKAIDITFYDKDGNEIEPKEGSDPLSVSFKSSKLENLNEPAVVHIDNKKVETISDEDVKNKGDKVSFEADQFSIYVVVETGQDARALVKFMNGETEIDSMYVKSGDDMETVLYDPSGKLNLDEGVIFKGWTTNPDYSVADAANALDIGEVRTEVSGMLPPVSDGKEIIYYAMLYKKYTVTYLDSKEAAIHQDSILYRTDATGNDLKQAYQVSWNYTPEDDTHDFEGWFAHEGGSNIEGFDPDANDGKGTLYAYEQDITISGDVTFSVFAPEGHWLVFDENGKGATYNAPKFIKSGENTVPPSLEMMRNGYNFVDWYYFPNGNAPAADPTTGEVDLTGATVFSFGGTISEKTTVYAKWNPISTANYTIIVWKQNLACNGYDYDEAASKTLSGSVGTVINTVTQQGTGDDAFARINGTDYKPTGFHLSRYDQNVRIKPEGNSVVNVYYDRTEYTLTFQAPARVNSPSNNDQNLYGYVEDVGGYVKLTRRNNRWEFYYNGSWLRYSYYGNGNYYHFNTVKTITAKYYQNISSNFPIVGDNGVTYNQGERWMPQNSTQFDDVIIFLEVMPAESITFHLDIRNYTTIRLRYYVEALDGDENTHSYQGNNYTLYNTIYANLGYVQKNLDWLDLVGYTKQTSNPTFGQASNSKLSADVEPQGADGSLSKEYDSDVGKQVYHLDFYYTRNLYSINYMDGAYVDGNGNTLTEPDGGQLGTENNIPYGSDISAHSDFRPTTTPAGYVFEGWYINKECTQKYNFTTMPEGGVTVYAKWRQIQYRVFLHPNAGTDQTLDWGSESQQMNFRVSYGGKISAPTGRRTGYNFIGWYTDEACTKVFPADSYVLNESSVTTPYDKEHHFTEGMDKWGNSATSNGDLERFWITKEFNLYGKWSKVLEGADGIHVIYSLVDPDAGTGTGNVSDNNIYVDNSNATAAAAVNAPEGYRFAYWIVQNYENGAYVDTDTHVYAGGNFTVLEENAKIEATGEYVKDKDDNYLDANGQITTNPANYVEVHTYTVQLRAKYVPIEDSTPTHIYWYKNDGTVGPIHEDPAEGQTLEINEGVDIQGAPERAGYDFVGWAKVDEPNNPSTYAPKDVTGTMLLYYDAEAGFTTDSEHQNVAEQVAADEDEPTEILVAVWEEKEVTINYAVAEDQKSMGTVSNETDTIPAVTGTPEGSTATPSSNTYVFDYWTCDDGTEHVGDAAEFTPSKNANGVYEEHTYYAHFKLNKATVTVHHYLKGTTTEVAEDVTSQETIGTEYTAQPVTKYQEKNLTVDSYNPSQKVTVSAEGNVITIYYTLPLTITVSDKTVPYTGNVQYGYGASVDEKDDNNNPTVIVDGLLEGDSVSELNYTRASGTNAGTYNNGEFTADPIIKKGNDEVSYYVITTDPGDLIISKAKVKVEVIDDGKVYGDVDPVLTWKLNDAIVEGSNAIVEIARVAGENVGQYNITASLKQDAVDNYEIDTDNSDLNGTFTISKRPITITAKSDSKPYDGEPLTNSGYTNTDNLVYGDTIDSVSVNGSQTLVGSSDNTPSSAVIKNGEKVVTNNYNITYEPGTLTVTDENVDPSLVVTKNDSKDNDYKYELGEEVTFTITVKNIYAEAKTITLTEIEGVTLANNSFEDVPAGETITTTATYNIKPADVAKGSFTNTVTATLNGKSYDATDTVKTEAANAAIEVTKTSEDSGVAVGDTVSYAITVKNTGNVTVSGLELADALAGVELSGLSVTELAPDEEATATATYEVQQKDVDAGKIVNTVTA